LTPNSWEEGGEEEDLFNILSAAEYVFTRTGGRGFSVVTVGPVITLGVG